MDIHLSAAVLHNGKIYLPLEDEVQDIALEMVGSYDRMYFDPIPLSNGLCLKYDKESPHGWELRTENGKQK